MVLLGLTTLVLAGWGGGAETSPVVVSGSAQRQAAAAPDAMYGPYQGNAAERLYDQASNWK
jgi:hypothetical protein